MNTEALADSLEDLAKTCTKMMLEGAQPGAVSENPGLNMVLATMFLNGVSSALQLLHAMSGKISDQDLEAAVRLVLATFTERFVDKPGKIESFVCGKTPPSNPSRN